MKRSGNVSLVVMGALAFTASFAGGSAFLTLQNRTPSSPSQACTTTVDGRQTCATQRRWTYLPSFHYWGYSGSATAATPAAATNSGARLVSGVPAIGPTGGEASTKRGGFGSSGRVVFRGSAAG